MMTSIQELKMQYGISGFDEKLEAALTTAVKVAPTDLSVLIQGESGVGKEVLPRIIHDHSLRKRKAYIAINCGSIPEGTIDSELFGHEKGSFTGAVGEREGYFGAADGGTLFLDEVGELPMATQARLLRVLESGEYIRVGSSQPRKTDVRIVAATNVNIQEAIRCGRFREDLYYRLSTINIKMPPLRERGNDAVVLFKKFALETAQKYRIPEPIRLTPDGEEAVRGYKWPGNIRQLKNITEQMSILCQNRMISADVLAQYDIIPGGSTTSMARIEEGSKSHHDYDKEITWLASAVLELRKEVNTLKELVNGHTPISHVENRENLPVQSQPEKPTQMPAHVPASTETLPAYDEIQTAEEVLEDSTLNLMDMEKKNIIRALERNKNRRRKAAEELGISERTLYRKIKDYGISE